MCLLAPVSNTSRHTSSSQKAHTLLVLTAELLPWLSAALECHQQSCAEQRVPSSHPNTQTHTWVVSAQAMSHHQRILCFMVTSQHSNTLHAQRTCHNFWGKEEKTTQCSRTPMHWKEQVLSAPSTQDGEQRYHQVTLKVCALRGRSIKSPAKHHHCAITLFPVINFRSHSKAGTSYFHNPAALGMQHVSALLLSALREATLQLQSTTLQLLQVSQCCSICQNLAHQFLGLKFLGYPKPILTTYLYKIHKLAQKFYPGMGTNQAIHTSTWKGGSKLLRRIKIRMYLEAAAPTVSAELSDSQQLPPDKTTCNKCWGIQSTTEPRALWYQGVIAPRCWRVWGIPGVTTSWRSKKHKPEESKSLTS